MRVIVTGATGFIGKALTHQLVAKGYEVIVLSRNLRKAQQLFSDRPITVAQWDAKTSQGWAHHADGAHAIINLAGENVMGLWTESKKRSIFLKPPRCHKCRYRSRAGSTSKTQRRDPRLGDLLSGRHAAAMR
jgi:NAD dependent epimerase/dehydratase family enzyme